MLNKEDFKRLASLAIEAQDINGHVVFVNYSGHIGAVEVSIRESKENFSNHLFDSGLMAIEEEGFNTEKRFNKTVSILERMIAGEEVFKPVKKVIIPEHSETIYGVVK